MRIAYISYEYPPDISAGGIATYTFQVAKMMTERGHDVEVFCGSYERTICEVYENVLTHRIKITDAYDFRKKIVEKFKQRHEYIKFDLFESPEINGNGYEIKNTIRDIPMVVKIHMPAVLQIRLFNYYTPLHNKLRFTISSYIKKKKIDLGLWSKHDKNQKNDIDYLITDEAQLITAPSQAMKNWAVNFWRIPENRISVIPNLYIPNTNYLKISVETGFNRVLFIGKLNVHKGLVKLTEAIPKVLRKHPEIKFSFIASDGPSHIKGITMKNYMLKKLERFNDNIEFIGSVPLNEISEHLSVSDFCVFPSLWECFGLVVCESMAAARSPIVSNNGGMLEIIEEGKTGISINPQNSNDIAKKIIYLIENKEIREKMGFNARKSILEKFNAEKIGKLTEEIYLSAISAKKTN